MNGSALQAPVGSHFLTANAKAIAMCALGADLAITYLNDRSEKFVRPLADQLGTSITMPCDVEMPGELEAVFVDGGFHVLG